MQNLKDLDITKKVRSTIFNIEKAPNMIRLSRLTNTTYSYQVNILNELENRKIITSKKIGRIRKYTFTEKGQRFKELLYELETLWQNLEKL